jgi:hypothetical protein
VRPHRRQVAARLLGRHVRRRAHHSTVGGPRGVLAEALGEAEVGELRPALAVDEDVPGSTSRWMTPAAWA